jgi:hypothetical protein
MRALARRAGVAFVTPFNLFESKAGVLLGLFEKRIDLQIQRLTGKTKPAGPIDRLFEQAIVGCRAYSADPALFKPLVREISNAGGFDYGRLTLRSTDLWVLALHDALEAGFVRKDQDLEHVARSLHLGFRWILWQWAVDFLDTSELEVHCQYSVSVTLLGALSDAGRTQVLERVIRLAAPGNSPC